MIEKFVKKAVFGVLGGAAASLARKEIVGRVGKLIDKVTRESPESIQARANALLGYPTTHYKVDKDGNIAFKPSLVFFHEYLTSHPNVMGRVLKDEETGTIYVDGNPINNSAKVELINQFLSLTKIHSAAVASHFDQACKLLETKDITSVKFQSEFGGKRNSTEIIDNWMTNCFGEGLETDPVYATFLFKKWITGTAKRIISPGSNHDGCLTMAGKPGTGKTQFFRLLMPPPFESRTTEVACSIKDSRKFTESILGRTIVNYDELAVLEHHKVIESFKQLLTSQYVDVRLAYRRDPQRYDLRQGFGATTNKDQFIKDANLSRRLWTIKLNGKKRLNFDYLRDNRRALWEEALTLAQNNYPSLLSEEEQKTVEMENKKYLL